MLYIKVIQKQKTECSSTYLQENMTPREALWKEIHLYGVRFGDTISLFFRQVGCVSV